jgi:HlyD family secretion protein
MNPQQTIKTVSMKLRRKPIIPVVLGIALIAGIIAVFATPRKTNQAYTFYDVRRGDFLISVVEGGTLEAVNDVVIRSEVEGTARIIYIVPEGTYVKKGELLVQLDSSSSEDAVNQQQITVEKNQLAYIQAKQQLEIQKSTVKGEVDAADLKVKIAKSDFEKYDKAEALQLIRNAEIEITNTRETLQIAEERFEWTKKLKEQGFETQANLDKDRLAVSQGKLKLEQANQALSILEKFDLPKKRYELEAAFKAAEENLERAKLQGEKLLAQYEADVQTQKSTLDLSKSKLQRDMKQLAATKVYAPQDGLVVYSTGGGGGDRRFSSESMIEEGAVVRYRQELIKLPDISEMKLTIRVHESHINHVRTGQPAYIVLDSMPDQRFRGVVNRVAPLPDGSSRWGNPNMKLYITEVLITDKLPNVKPGVSARAEVVITNMSDALTVPIQAVTTRKGRQVVFLASAPQKPVPVTVGMYNNRFIEITTGVKETDRVMLSPPFDPDEKDLAGAVIAAGEGVPTADSNQVARIASTATGRNGPAFADAAGAAPDGEGRRQRGPRGEGGVGGGGERNFPGREEMLKQFDANGDGQLDEAERAAMRERFGGRERRRPSTNAAPPAVAVPPDVSR